MAMWAMKRMGAAPSMLCDGASNVERRTSAGSRIRICLLNGSLSLNVTGDRLISGELAADVEVDHCIDAPKAELEAAFEALLDRIVHQVADRASQGGDRTTADRDATRAGVIIPPSGRPRRDQRAP